MAADGFTTVDLWLAATICMVYGTDCLTTVELDGESVSGKRPTPTFHLDIASCDGDIMREDLQNGCLAVSDVKALSREYSFLTKTLAGMKRGGQLVWHSRSWLQGRGN
jgi:hypothetical protein